MKRIVAFLTLLMILVSSTAFAEGVVIIGEKNKAQDTHNRAERVSGPHKSGYWEYYLLDDGTAEISGHDYENHKPDTLTVPATLDGYQVSSIGYNGVWGYSATIIIPDSVQNVLEAPVIAGYCKKISVSPDHPTLATINGVLFNKEHKRLLWYPPKKTDSSYAIPNGIREIAHHAFELGGSLQSVTIPDTVVRIDGNPFNGLYKLTRISVSDSHPNLVMKGNALIDQDTGTLHTYLISSNAETFTVPDGVTDIAPRAFMYAKPQTIVFPEGLASIGEKAFWNCNSRLTLSLPEGLTYIGPDAFAYSQYITSVQFPSTLEVIGDGAFRGTKLGTVTLPDGLVSIGNRAFSDEDGVGAINVTIPASVEYIGKNAFRRDVILTVEHDSYAQQYARSNNYEYTYPDSLDWLLD
ncbi:MAG: leucine-rich repeat domain-containing protein [Clostridia bacterium]|nr:leucine-rich repeat domain-containing protein [Clostridia bacterium]